MNKPFSILLILFVAFFVSCNREEIELSKMTDDEKIDYYMTAYESVFEKGDLLFKECGSAREFGKHLGEIKAIKGVKNAYVEDRAIFIIMPGGGTVSYYYPPSPSFPSAATEEVAVGFSSPNTRSGDYPNSRYVGHYEEYKTACIINQLSKDERFAFLPQVAIPQAKAALENIGITVKEELSPTKDFFKKDLYQYDIAFIITHGLYDSNTGRHWLVTSDTPEWTDKVRDFFVEFVASDRDKDPVDFCTITETRQGKSVSIKYLMVNDDHIRSAGHKFPNAGRAIVFNVACQSLKGNDNLWEAFKERGAGFYLGYDQTNNVGETAGMYFLGYIASGMSLVNAYNILPISTKKNYHAKTETEDEFTAWLRYRYDTDSDISSSCIARPSVSGYLDMSTRDNLQVCLKGESSLYDPRVMEYNNPKTLQCKKYKYDFDHSGFRYGFCISETPDIKNGIMTEPLEIGAEGCSYLPYKVSFSSVIDGQILSEEKQYYYWSYLYDGHDYIFSEGDTFTTARINQVIPPEILDRMDDYIPIYDGVNPPDVTGQYVASPFVIEYDSTNQHNAGDRFTDVYFKFYNQDLEKNTLDFYEKEGKNTQVGTGAFISGEGEYFSVFFNTDGTGVYDDYTIWFKTALVISGIKTSSGIKDLQYAFVLVDKGDDPSSHLIEIGSFRVFKDKDGLSTKTSYFGSSARARTSRLPYNPSTLPLMFEVKE